MLLFPAGDPSSGPWSNDRPGALQLARIRAFAGLAHTQVLQPGIGSRYKRLIPKFLPL
jgi:hypothetical protein